METGGDAASTKLMSANAGETLDEDDALRLAELVLAFVEWRARGGFRPRNRPRVACLKSWSLSSDDLAINRDA